MGACCRKGDRNEALDQKEEKLGDGGLRIPDAIGEQMGKPSSLENPQESEQDILFREKAQEIRTQNDGTNVFKFVAA